MINCDQCNGGAIQAIQSTINIQNAVFKEIQSAFGGAVFIYGINNTNYIQNTQFISCQAQVDGGGMYLVAQQNDKFKLEITESLFENNSCVQRGGGIYFDSETLNSPNQQIKLQNCQVIRNRAAIGGGIFLQNISTDVQQQNVISSNSASIYGSDQSSYPTQLRISNIDEFLSQNDGIVNKEQIEIHRFRSGANLTRIELQLLNQKDEIVLPTAPEEEDLFEISVQFDSKTQNPQSYIATGQISTKYDKNLKSFTFSYINLVGLPGTDAFLQFSSKQIYSVDPKNGKFVQNYTFNILIKFRNCGPGEQINKLGQIKECQICPENYYSFNVENCKPCPIGAECHGSTNLVTKQGYWRKSNDSDIILKCSNLLQNCYGGSYGDNICFEGHIGALCEECDIYGNFWPHTYSKSSKFSCTRCDQITGNIWIVSLMTVWTLISMVLAIKGNIEILQEKAAAQVLQKNLKGRRRIYLDKQQDDKTKFLKNSLSFKNQRPSQSQPTSDQEKSGVFIKMLTNYIQIVGSIATFNLSIPSGIFEFPQSVGQPLKQTMNSLDCALEGLDTKMPIIYIRLLFSLLIPIIYMALFLFCIGFYHLFKKLIIKCQKKESKNYSFPWYIITTATMFLIIYVQPDLVAQIIALLSCRQIGDTQYILSNVSFVCYTKQHYYYAFFLLLPLLLVWVVILPLILFLALKKNKKNIESIQIKLKYGFLYKEYQVFAYYWEFVKMVEKLAIILILNFYSQSIITKGVLVFMVITVYGILSLIIHPYQESDINEIDVNSTNVCALTVLLGIFIYNNPFDYFIYSSLALIVIINLWFIIKILGKILKGYLPMIQQTIQQILTKLSKKIPYLNKFIKENNKRQINADIKKKFQTLFKKYLSLSSKEKKRILLSTIEFQLETQYGQQLKSSKENQLPEQQSSKIPKYSQKQNINLNEEEQIKNLWLDQDNMIFIPTIQIDTIQNFNNCNTEMAIQNEQKEAATSRLKEQQSNQYLIQFQSSDSISNQVCSNNQNQNNTNTSIQLTKQGQQNKKNLSQYQKKHKNIKIQSNNPTAYVQNYQDLGLNQKQEINIYSLDALDNLDTQNNFYDPANSQQEDQNEEKMTNQQQQQLNIVSDTEQLQQESANKYQKINDNINVQEDLVNQKVTINNLVNELVYSKITRLKDQITQSNSEVIQFKDEDSIGNEDQYDTYVENNMNQLENKTKTNYQNNDNCDAEVQRQQKQVLDHVVNNNLIQFSQNDIENQFEYSSVQSEKNGDSKEIQVEEN